MIIKSNKNNLYYLSKIKPQLFIIHPMLKKIIELYSEGVNVQNIIKYKLYKSYKIRSANDIFQFQYYLTYYHFLKKNGYFEKQEYIPIEKARKYNDDKIKFNLANTDKITFEITDACNLNCKYCGYGKLYEGYDLRVEKKIDFNMAKTFLDYILDLKRSKLNVKTYRSFGLSFYGGEPLLNFSFIEKMINYTKSINIYPNKFYYQMTTNGILLDKYISFFMKHNFHIAISIDGNVDNNSYRIFKNGRSSFSKLTRNIEMIKVKFPDYFKKNIEFVSVLHNRNDPEKLETYFKGKYNKSTRILPISEQNIRKTKLDEFKKMKYYNYAQDQTSNINEFGSINTNTFIKTFCGYVLNYSNGLLSNEKKRNFICTGTCHPFEKSAFLTVNGKILPCERIPQNNGLGQIKNGKVEIDYKEVAAIYNSLYSKLKVQCNICKRSDECVKCLFYLKLDSPRYQCPDFLNNLQLKKRTEKIMSLLENEPNIYRDLVYQG